VTNAQVFRPLSGIALAATVFLICGVLVASHLQNVGIWLWGAAACAGAWLVFVRPKLVIGDEGVVVVNPLQTITLGWATVDALDVKYALTFIVGGRKVTCWSATAPSRYHGRSIHKSELLGIGINKRDIEAGVIRPGESPRTASGQAIALCRLRWRAFAEAIENGQQPATSDNLTKWNLLGAGALVLLVVAGLAVNYLG